MDLCEHLKPIAEHLDRLGHPISEQYTNAWGLHVIVHGPADQEGVPKDLVVSPVVPWTEIQPFFFPTQGFICKAHSHEIGWRMSETQIQEALAERRARE
jgi:hypothetical protein